MIPRSPMRSELKGRYREVATNLRLDAPHRDLLHVLLTANREIPSELIPHRQSGWLLWFAKSFDHEARRRFVRRRDFSSRELRCLSSDAFAERPAALPRRADIFYAFNDTHFAPALFCPRESDAGGDTYYFQMWSVLNGFPTTVMSCSI